MAATHASRMSWARRLWANIRWGPPKVANSPLPFYNPHEALSTVLKSSRVVLLMEDLDLFCCQNPDCPDYGLRSKGNLRVCFRYGKQKRRMLACRSCQGRFSE